MKLIQIKCPNCGAKLDVSTELKSFTCNYCGTKTLIDDEVIKVEHKIIDNGFDELIKKIDGYLKLEYLDDAIKTSYILIDKYPYNPKAWFYKIKAITNNFDKDTIDDLVYNKDILSDIEECYDNYMRLSEDEVEKEIIIEKYKLITKASKKLQEKEFTVDGNIELTCPFCGAPIFERQKYCKECNRELWWPEE